MNGKDLLSIHELSSKDLLEIWKMTKLLKKKKASKVLHGKTLATIFQKPSTRTRVSFEVGMFQLGGHALYLKSEEMQMGRGETTEDTARTLSQYVDGIMIRAYKHSDVEQLARHAKIPVINGLSDFHHPCQVLSDIYTIMEKKKWDVSKNNTKKFNKLKFAYIGDGDNVAHSIIEAAAALGIQLVVATPRKYAPNSLIVKRALGRAKKTGSKITVTTDPGKAAESADVIYTDVWTSMGMEKEAAKRRKDFKKYQINTKLLKHAKKDVMVMHCLPAHRGEEITGDVIDGPNSIVFQQAANRLHVQKAVLVLLLNKNI